MSVAFLIQTLASLVAVLLLAGLAWWLGVMRHNTRLDEASVRALLADDFPGQPVERLWIGADGHSALARSGDQALILYRVGDGHAARCLPWDQAVTSQSGKGGVAFRFADVTAPRARFTPPDGMTWPPAEGVL